MITTHRFGLVAALLATTASAAHAVEGLGGSPASMVRQHSVAVQEEYTFLRTPLDVQRLVVQGKLVSVVSDSLVTLSGVSFPYSRPEVQAFIARMGRDFRDSTGGMLTITSLTRPAALQPRNAHRLSVHPAGMAVDFRVPREPAERAFLERRLLAMEKAGLIEATRERRPAHYHVAVFAEPMLAYTAGRDSVDAIAAARTEAARASAARAAGLAMSTVARVRVTDSVNESRLPLLFLAMGMLLGMGLLVLHAPRLARQRDD